MPKSSRITDTLETTLGIIKPDGICKRKEIIRKIKKNGFHILYNKKFQLSPEQAADFLKDRENNKNFSIFVFNLSNGPIEVLILSKENAINDFLALMGPEKPSRARCSYPGTIRAEFGDTENDFLNAIHGSCSMKSARKEIHFFLPNFIYEPIERIKPEELLSSYSDITGTLINGLHYFTKEQPSEPIIWFSKWLLENNKNFPIITETSASDSKIVETNEKAVGYSTSSTCNSFKNNSISSILNSIMSSSSITTNSNTILICDEKEDESPIHDGINDIKICDDRRNNPCICPKCNKLIKVPNCDVGMRVNESKHNKKLFLPKNFEKSSKSTSSTGLINTNEISEKSSSISSSSSSK